MSNEFTAYLANHGIQRQHTVRNEPHQNGIAERANRTLAEGITAMLNEARVPKSFWGHALGTFVHVHNRSPSSALASGTPYSNFYKKKPDVSHFRVFGCTAYVHIQKDQRRGLDSHTQKCIFIGYPDDYKGWRFYNPDTRKIVISNTAEFDERVFPGTSRSSSTATPSTATVPVSYFVPAESPPKRTDAPEQVGDNDNNAPPPQPPQPPQVPTPQPSPSPSPQPSPNPSPSPSPPPSPPPPPGSRRSVRTHVPREIWGPKQWTVPHPSRSYREPTPVIESDSDDSDHPTPGPSGSRHSRVEDVEDDDDDGQESFLAAHMQELLEPTPESCYVAVGTQAYDEVFKASAHGSEPRSFAEAMRRPDADKWFDAANLEIQQLLDNGTWEVVQLPPGRKAIGCRWVFKVKRNADGTIERYKGRLVAKGFSQRPGFEYTETFAPTAKWAALRAVLAIAAYEDLELESVDISTAFLNGNIDTDVYMQQPEGFEQGEPDWVLKLRKAIYGLKQASRMWHIVLDKALREMGFTLVKCDHSIWVYKRGDIRIIIPVFVDDMTIAAKSKAEIEKVKDELKRRFKLRDLGPTTFLLGVEIIRDRPKRTLQLSQRQYILDMLERYGFSEIGTASTPMYGKLSADQCPKTQREVDEMKQHPYAHAVGSLMYLAVSSRPDISYAVGVLCRFNSNPGLAHWTAVKHLFRYLKSTLDYKLTYSPDPSCSEMFQTFSDADHGGNPDNGRSTTGYLVKMGTGAICWGSKLQGMVSLSTTEAEYIAACTAGQEILWLRNLLTEFGYDLSPTPSTMFIDNQSAIAVGKNPEHHGRMKHLDLRHYWLRDTVNSGVITLVHCPTTQMPADLLTKPLAAQLVARFRDAMGMRL